MLLNKLRKTGVGRLLDSVVSTGGLSRVLARQCFLCFLLGQVAQPDMVAVNSNGGLYFTEALR